MASGAAYFLEGLIGRKKVGNGSKERSDKEGQKKTEVVPTKKEKPQKMPKKVVPLRVSDSSEWKKALEDLNVNFHKAYNASSKLKKLAKDGGTDIKKLQIEAFHPQMKVIFKMLENLKK